MALVEGAGTVPGERASLPPVCGLGTDARGGGLQRRGLQRSVTASSGHRAEKETGCHETTAQHPGQGAAPGPEGRRPAERPAPGAAAARGGGQPQGEPRPASWPWSQCEGGGDTGLGATARATPQMREEGVPARPLSHRPAGRDLPGRDRVTGFAISFRVF